MHMRRQSSSHIDVARRTSEGTVFSNTQNFKDMSTEAFTDAVYNYDQISKLDPWRTTILLKIKGEMAKANGEGNDLT